MRKLIRGSQAGGDGPSGFGLFNVAQRIFLNYGAEYSLSIDSEAGEWTESVVEIPAVKN